MLGPLTAGKKAAELGYKVYGVPGAAVAGAGGAVGMVVAKKGVEAVVETESGAEVDTIADEGTEIDIEWEDDADEFDDAAPADR
jgi:outer membrane lipoprotein SlyB